MTGLDVQSLGANPAEALSKALDYSSYLRGLDRRYGFIDQLEAGKHAQDMLSASIAKLGDLDADLELAAVKQEIRRQKAMGHFALAGLDLSGVFSQTEITEGITALADASVRAALQAAASAAELKTDGLVIFALGKMGAGELNYSSDIDMIAFVDPEQFDGRAAEPAQAATKLIKSAMQILEERTADGYAFRTDLRLRPDPSSTPLAVPINRAEAYYQSIGQNWERMAWIKGRVVAGDQTLGKKVLSFIKPFVWRRHLDYWAIADVRAIKAMINTRTKALDPAIRNPDVKLGPGGIREIEFFVQTQQIILGGRHEKLRLKKTKDVLTALAEHGAIDHETASELSQAYDTLRAVEHRVQMRLDEQTHTLPKQDSDRADVAALCGASDLDAFDKALFQTRQLVNKRYSELFAEDVEGTAAPETGNFVFTGVDDDPGTFETLSQLGFSDPSYVINAIRLWHRGRTPATRSERGRELLTALLPKMLTLMSQTGEPDKAFLRFRRFFEALRSGVQILSMLKAEPALLDDLVTTLALAPRIGEILARKPELLEALLYPKDQPETFQPYQNDDFETAMDRARIWHSEHSFQIGHRLLHGALESRAAAAQWSALADDIIKAMANAAEIETMRLFGPKPGNWTLIGLGRLGGEAMTAESDLDLLVIYEAEGDLDAQTWFTRFTQRLITALSAETAKGSLYEVDMRLRPSGRAGPVASSITAFERYHRKDAWTWEHMALTRMRCVAGDASLGQKALDIAWDVIAHGGTETNRLQDILDMRRRLARDKPPKGPWDLKMQKGGLIDVEFIIQAALLSGNVDGPVSPRLEDAIETLLDRQVFSQDEADKLLLALDYLQRLLQIQRLTLGSDYSRDDMSEGLKNRFCRAVSAGDFDTVEAQLEDLFEDITRLRCKKIGSLATESEQ